MPPQMPSSVPCKAAADDSVQEPIRLDLALEAARGLIRYLRKQECRAGRVERPGEDKADTHGHAHRGTDGEDCTQRRLEEVRGEGRICEA